MESNTDAIGVRKKQRVREREKCEGRFKLNLKMKETNNNEEEGPFVNVPGSSIL